MKYVTVVRYFTNSNIFAKKLSKTDLVIFIVYMCRLFILRVKDLEVVIQYITYYKKNNTFKIFTYLYDVVTF